MLSYFSIRARWRCRCVAIPTYWQSRRGLLGSCHAGSRSRRAVRCLDGLMRRLVPCRVSSSSVPIFVKKLSMPFLVVKKTLHGLLSQTSLPPGPVRHHHAHGDSSKSTFSDTIPRHTRITGPFCPAPSLLAKGCPCQLGSRTSCAKSMWRLWDGSWSSLGGKRRLWSFSLAWLLCVWSLFLWKR